MKRALWMILLALGCGARSELEVGEPPRRDPNGPSSEFCVEQEYRSIWRDLSIYVLLDRSASMEDDGKWDKASAALASFVDSPEVAGLGVGLQYYPLSPACDVNAYATPAVDFGRLPDNSESIKTSLADQVPQGDTPMRPALRGAIEYSRALLLGDPTHGVAVALTTDGAPNVCDSTSDTVAAVAAEGARGDPQVLTFVIGLDTGYTVPLEIIARAGGTGEPIIIGGQNAAQRLVDALLEVRDNLLRCRYAVPAAPGFEIKPRDVTVRYRLGNDPTETALSRVKGPEACGAESFWVDDPPTKVELCPSVCAKVQGTPNSRVIVTAGCGEGGEPVDAGPPPTGDCDSTLPFYCVTQCGSQVQEMPLCVGGAWTCPAGMVTTQSCKECPVVPHGCCKSDGTQALASCINGAWVCPPGSKIFGSPGCVPPDVCAATLPCPLGSYCQVEDASCGGRELLGHCEPLPTSCGSDGPAVCACNGQSYPNSCQAALAKQDISTVDACAAPAGTFACGPYFCTTASQLCLEVDTPSDMVKHRYQCVPKTGTCQTGCAGCDPCPRCPPNKTCPADPTCSTRGGSLTITCLQL